MTMSEAAAAPLVDTPRDYHLFGPGPKRILSLDGGGVRGAILVAFLQRIEKILDEHAGQEVRLGDWFDLISGTLNGRHYCRRTRSRPPNPVRKGHLFSLGADQVGAGACRVALSALQCGRWGP